MKKNTLFLLAILPVLLSAQSENFEDYASGKNICEESVKFKSVPGLAAEQYGQVTLNSADPVNPGKVLEQKHATMAISRLADFQQALTGEIYVTLDIKLFSGDSSIYVWQNEQKFNDLGALISFSGDNIICGQGNHGINQNIGQYKKGIWYRVVMTIHLSRSAENFSTYDVLIQDLADNKTIASQNGLRCPGNPVSIQGGQVLSLGQSGSVHVLVDNINFSNGDANGKQISDNAIFAESFSPRNLEKWQIQTVDSTAQAKIIHNGNANPTCLEIDKKDRYGALSISRKIPLPANLSSVQVSADFNTVLAGPFSEYFLDVTQFNAADQALGTPQSYPFSDAMTYVSEFGGSTKTPQTLGEWRTTSHLIPIQKEAAALELKFYFRNGNQQLKLDNVRVLNSDGTHIDNNLVYQKELNGPGALLNLDMLLPGFTYEVETQTAPVNNDDFAMRISFRDLKNNISQPQTLIPVKKDGEKIFFRFSIPENAVESRLDLYNQDLAANIALADYRNWKNIKIRTVSTLPATDQLFTNYLHQSIPGADLGKPREVIEVSAYDVEVLNAHLAKRSSVDATVESVNGAMAMKIGEKLYPPMFNASLHTFNRFDVYSELVKRGLPIIRIDNQGSGPAFNGQWLGEDQYDFSSVDQVMYAALKNNPDAFILFHTGGLYPPNWWGDAHPDEIMQDDQGLSLSIFDSYAYSRVWGPIKNGQLAQFHENKWNGNYWMRNRGNKVNTCYFPSPGSRLYRDAMKKYLRALCEHIAQQPYGKAVIGYTLSWGYDMQWGYPVIGNADEIMGQSAIGAPHNVDYSPAMKNYFRNFLKEKYQTDAKLRQAWNDPKITFAGVEIPVAKDPFSNLNPLAKPEILLNPSKDQKQIDWNLCSQTVIGDLVEEMGVAIKAANQNKVLVVAYFSDVERELGHDIVTHGKGIDISGGPSYDSREIGQAGLMPFFYDSYRLHNKIAFTEVDHRVFSVMYRKYKGNQVFETPRKSISILQREYARQICNGNGAWSLDMGLGWFTHPIIADTMENIQQVFQKVLPYPRESNAKIAMFFGDYNSAVMAAPQHGTYLNHLVRNSISTAPLAGVPIDIFRLSDLNAVADRYQVFIFPYLYGMEEKDFEAIRQLQKNGNLLIFGPAAGYVGESKQGKERLENLTGMTLANAPAKTEWLVKPMIDSSYTSNLSGLLGSDPSEQNRIFFPQFTVNDPASVNFGNYKNSSLSGFAQKNNGTWQSIYFGFMGALPPDFLRNIAKTQNIHVYNDSNDPMFFNKSLVAIHAATDGLKTIRLPRKYKIHSLWDNQDLGILETIKRPMKTGDNALYLLEEIEDDDMEKK